MEPYKGYPMDRIVAHSDRVLLKQVRLTIEGEEIVDQERQTRLPCSWLDGRCRAEGITYLWNITDPQYCQLAVVKEFKG